MSISHHDRRVRFVAGVAGLLAALGSVVALSGGPAAATPTFVWSVTKPVCAQPADVNTIRCYAERSVDVASGTAGAQRTADIGHGPTGGYSPTDIARAYGYNPSAKVSQTVAVVDWYDDPYALADLNVFNHEYHYPAETATSFRKVNQDGATSPLPKPNRDMAGEIALDIQAVRGVCHGCRIVLVEANQPSNADLARAENTAARLGATEISNSWGGPEGTESGALATAFKHPGTVITASTGDDGWYGWDNVNDGYSDSDNAAAFPSTSPYVVSVGGTRLTTTASGARAAETVWNNNGNSDSVGSQPGNGPEGASGGGCSVRYTAPTWQADVRGYSAVNCHGRRLAADVSALADPKYGYDVFDRYGGPLYTSRCSTLHPSTGCWARAGGTSLSSPVVAAMYALAGGSGGSAYPAASLYVNTDRTSSLRYDVTVGGNSFCGDASVSACATATYTLSGYATNNPNGLVRNQNGSIRGERLDCSFKRDGSSIATSAPPPTSAQCAATTGFDGPSGIGTPRGLSMFADTSPNATFVVPTSVGIRSTHTYRASLRVTPGARIVAVSWAWGDGTTTAGSASAARVTHRFTRDGTYRVTFAARDSFGQMIYRQLGVRVH